MKKLFTIIALITMFFSANSQNLYKITSSSFDTLNPVLSGSEQWIDVKCDLPYGEQLTVYCFSSTSINNANVITKILLSQNDLYFESLPSNLDSSKRIYFNVPWDIQTGYFSIVTNFFSQGVALGKVIFATSVIELTSTPSQIKYTYTNLLGQSTTQLKGLLIRSDQRLVYFE